MEDKLIIEIEDAKSLFVIAQIAIILAGFMFASAGIAYSSSINQINLIHQDFYDKVAMNDKINNYNISLGVNDISSSLGEIFKSQVKLFWGYMISGIIFTLFSFGFFFLGKYKISKLKKR